MQSRVYQEYYQILRGTGVQVPIYINFSIYLRCTDSRRGGRAGIGTVQSSASIEQDLSIRLLDPSGRIVWRRRDGHYVHWICGR